jgi:hypothetical protein
MTTEITQNLISLWLQPDGKGNALELLSIDRHGAGDKTIPRSGRDLVSGRDAYGNPRIKKTVKTPPGGLITFNLEWTKVATPEFLETVARCNAEFGLWEFFIPCGRLDNPSLYGRLDYYGGLGVTQQVNGAGPVRDGTGADVVNNVDVSGVYWVAWVPLELALQSNPSIEDLFDIAGLKDCAGCFAGYPGPDEILYAAGGASAGSPGDTADLMYTENGGGLWTNIGLGSNPFAAAENIGDVEIMMISKTQYRLVVGRSTVDAGAPAEVAWSNVTLGDPGTYSWTNVNVGSTNGQVIEALAWLFYDRLYAAAGGDIFVSTDQSEAYGSAIYTGATVINAFAKDTDDNVWAVGETNLILREPGKSGTFETRTGPSGGGTFYSVAVAADGRLYAGNAQYIYVSTNAALNTGGWTQLKDFGVNHTVIAIHLAGQSEVDGGDSQLITAVVDDTSGGAGELWRSWDGGNSWRQTTELTNVGYNAAHFSDQDDNLVIIVGDANATPMGVIHQATPCASC